jgi:hypothetical protein
LFFDSRRFPCLLLDQTLCLSIGQLIDHFLNCDE